MSSAEKVKMVSINREELVKLARRISDLTFELDRMNVKAYSISKTLDKILTKSAITLSDSDYDSEDEKYIEQRI